MRSAVPYIGVCRRGGTPYFSFLLSHFLIQRVSDKPKETPHETILPILLLLAALPTPAAPGPRQTQIRPGELWEDANGNHINAHGGGLLLHEGRVWWFGEHKAPGTAGNQAWVGVHCYSSPADDLVNWRDEGIALRVSDDPKSDIAKGCILERPKVVYNAKTGKFVMWFHLELKGQGYAAARYGVAVADRVEGPYAFLRSGRVNPGVWAQDIPAGKRTLAETPAAKRLSSSAFPEDMDKAAIYYRDFTGGQMARDMTVFVDDDGIAYHIYASEDNGTLQIAELDDTYTRHTGRYARLFEGRFMEAPPLQEGRQILVHRLGLHRLGPQRRALRRRRLHLGPLDRAGQPRPR